ncbi:TPA: hypothetical protein ACHLBF_005221, partial [Escherichia coli]
MFGYPTLSEDSRIQPVAPRCKNPDTHRSSSDFHVKEATMPQPTLMTDWICIATSGPTVDGR